MWGWGWRADYRVERHRRLELTEVVVAARQVDGVLETDTGRQRGEDAEPEENCHRHLGVAVHLDRAEETDGPAFGGASGLASCLYLGPE